MIYDEEDYPEGPDLTTIEANLSQRQKQRELKKAAQRAMVRGALNMVKWPTLAFFTGFGLSLGWAIGTWLIFQF